MERRSDDRFIVWSADQTSVRMWWIVVYNESYKTQVRLLFFKHIIFDICAIHCAQVVHAQLSRKNIFLHESAWLARICTNLHVSNTVYMLFNYLEKSCTTNQFFRKLEKRAKLFRKIEFLILSVTHTLFEFFLFILSSKRSTYDCVRWSGTVGTRTTG